MGDVWTKNWVILSNLSPAEAGPLPTSRVHWPEYWQRSDGDCESENTVSLLPAPDTAGTFRTRNKKKYFSDHYQAAMFDHQRIFCSFLLLCLLSSKVSVKTEFLPQFEETVRNNITVQELWTKIFSILARARAVISQTGIKKINSGAAQQV